MTEPHTGGQPTVTAPTVTRPAPPPDRPTMNTCDHTGEDTETHAAVREDPRVALVTDATDVITELAAAEHLPQGE